MSAVAEDLICFPGGQEYKYPAAYRSPAHDLIPIVVTEDMEKEVVETSVSRCLPCRAALARRMPFTFCADAIEASEYAAKYRIYEQDYLRLINHKYFSRKNLAGTGRVFETVSTVDGFTVKESRERPVKRFLELPSSAEERHNVNPKPYYR
ncbi:hypothetical protein R1flu_025907 [Riccia fluitans]|uniref:Uncharacterized protein n=1 Tax=Riccia fluitans TaxID=41844 RepID=A0ABD1XZH3_9MARC